MAKARTMQDVFKEVSEKKDRAAVYAGIANWLRAHYIGRDSAAASKQFARDRAPVPESLVEEIACELEESAKDLDKEAKVLLAEEA